MRKHLSIAGMIDVAVPVIARLFFSALFATIGYLLLRLAERGGLDPTVALCAFVWGVIGIRFYDALCVELRKHKALQ